MKFLYLLGYFFNINTLAETYFIFIILVSKIAHNILNLYKLIVAYFAIIIIYPITIYILYIILTAEKHYIDTAIVIITLIGLILNSLSAEKIMEIISNAFILLLIIFLVVSIFFITIGFIPHFLDFVHKEIFLIEHTNFSETHKNHLTTLVIDKQEVFLLLLILFIVILTTILKFSEKVKNRFAIYWTFILVLYIYSTLKEYTDIVPKNILSLIFN